MSGVEGESENEKRGSVFLLSGHGLQYRPATSLFFNGIFQDNSLARHAGLRLPLFCVLPAGG